MATKFWDLGNREYPQGTIYNSPSKRGYADLQLENSTVQNFKATHAKPIDLHHLSPNCHRFSTILVAKGRSDKVPFW
ncbi:hypothetical protein MTR_2g041710 [Medicago truncatula]|uniref:Uncharacterized protein n=1 Tax=Medicago truncatula TaxID=3880 RepID=A0A072V690_MEDTR|nr:hypothetical protein MTR_2g041710 [Medicago truncatula]